MQNGSGITCLMLAGLLVFAASPQAAAQQAAAPSAGQSATRADVDLEELEEVVVRGGRLFDLIVEAEDRFFKLYNELNRNPDFATNCAYMNLDPDSRLEQRVCMPSFFADAKAEQVRYNVMCASMTARDEEGEILSRGVCYEAPPAELIFMDRRDSYVRNVVNVINSDPRLQEMAGELDDLHRERQMLARRYEDIKTREQAASFDARRSNRPGAR